MTAQRIKLEMLYQGQMLFEQTRTFVPNGADALRQQFTRQFWKWANKEGLAATFDADHLLMEETVFDPAVVTPQVELRMVYYETVLFTHSCAVSLNRTTQHAQFGKRFFLWAKAEGVHDGLDVGLLTIEEALLPAPPSVPVNQPIQTESPAVAAEGN